MSPRIHPSAIVDSTAQLGADVEIGACTTIDRGAIGATVIGAGTKIDNLVQIAHNCVIGQHNAFASQVGVAGSSHERRAGTLAHAVQREEQRNRDGHHAHGDSRAERARPEALHHQACVGHGSHEVAP